MTNRRSFIKSFGLGSAFPFFQSKSDDKKLRFAIASDGHYGQESTAYAMYFEHIIRWLNMEHEKTGLDLAIFNGDLIHDNPGFLSLIKGYFSKLEMPYWLVRGNHDQVSQAQWQSTWGYPTNHVFHLHGCAFILADTSNQSGDYKCADLMWLNEALANNQSEKAVFVFLHINQSDWTIHGVDCPEIMKLLTEYKNVKAVFHGHDHQEDYIKYFRGKPFLFSGHFGGSWGVEYKGYRIVESISNGTFLTYQYHPEADAKLYPIVIGQ